MLFFQRAMFLLSVLASALFSYTYSGCGEQFTGAVGAISYSPNSSISNTRYNGFACPDKKDEFSYDSVTIKNINFKSGGYVCSYLSSTGEVHDIALVNTQCKKNEEAFLVEIKNNGMKSSGSNVYGGIPIKDSSGRNTKLDIDELIQKTEELKNLKLLQSATQPYSINSNQEGKISLSQMLVATITIDRDYFNSGPLVNEFGDINLKGFGEFSQQTETSWGKIKSIAGFDPGQASIQTDVAILDKKIWGFFVIFIENIRMAEQKIVMYLFMMGFGLLAIKSTLQHGSSLLFEKNGGDSRVKWQNIVGGPMIFMTIFAAPVIPNASTVPSNLVKQDSELSGLVLSQSNTQTTQYSTIIQSMIRFFATWGNKAANDFSDFALFSYLQFIEAKQGVVTKNNAGSLQNSLMSFYGESLELKRMSDFYADVCLRTFSGMNGTFVSQTEEQLDGLNKTVGTFSQNGIDQLMPLKNNNWDRVDANYCKRLEMQVRQKAAQNLAVYSGVKANIDMLHREYTGVIDERLQASRVKYVRNFNENLAKMHEQSGWISIAAVPTMYTFFKLSDILALSETEEQTIQIPRTERDYGLLSDETADTINSLGTGMATFILKAPAHFILPGFGTMFSGVNAFLEKQGATIEKLLNLIGKIPAPGVGKAVSIVANIAMGAASAILVPLVAFVVTLFVYGQAIKIIVLLSASLMITFKIIMHYLEMLLYFVASSAVVIWATVSNKEQAIYTFAGRGATLIVTPVLIVLSGYIFIFGHELLMMLHEYIGAMIEASLIDGNIALAPHDGFGMFGRWIQIQTWKAISEIVVDLFVIYFAYSILMNFTDWFFKTVGVQGNVLESAGNTLIGDTKKVAAPI